MSVEKLYPDLDCITAEETGETEIDKEDLKRLIDKKAADKTNFNLYKERFILMDYKKDNIIDSLKRYLKNKKSYNTANTVVKITGLATSIGLAVVAIVITSGIAAPIFVVPMCGGLTLLSIGVSESIQKFLRIKKHRAGNKINILKDTISKIEVFIEKARDDKNITPQEIEAFYKLLKDNTDRLSNVNTNTMTMGLSKKKEQKVMEGIIRETMKELMTSYPDLQRQAIEKLR